MLLETAFVVGLAAVHLFASRLRFLEVRPRSRWLSLAGGMAVAYVFIRVFPELHEAQRRLVEAWNPVPLVEHHVYLAALAGLATFYGVQSVVSAAQRTGQGAAASTTTGETSAGMAVFWLHMAAFSVYNGLVGYLLVRGESSSDEALTTFFIAMAVHFLVNDLGLSEDHRQTYRRMGRWLLAGAIVAGFLAGLAVEISRAATDVCMAFLAGGLVLNVLKEELPDERQSRFWPFLLGAAGYSALLLWR